VPVKVNGFALTAEKIYQMSQFLERVDCRKRGKRALQVENINEFEA
jgi:hypothetical protein